MISVFRPWPLGLVLFFTLGGLAAASPSLAALIDGDRAALLAFDQATGGVLSQSGGWGGPPGTECTGSWMGVQCAMVQGQERVVQLLLGQNQIPLSLSGSLPAEIGNLTALTQFELTDQSLAGDLPASLAMLVNMVYLDFRHNQFGGGSSAASGLAPFLAMSNLQFLDLEGNSITGSIPDGIGQLSRLTNLQLTGNELTGAIPAALGQLSQLQKLWLDTNQLEASIPAELGNLGNLVELRLGGNNLVGSIPAEIGSLHSLTLLELGTAQLSGALPGTLANLTSLQELSLGTNSIGGDLNGVAWQSLGQLQRVFLDNNALTGTIPPALLQLNQLSTLHLQGNGLTGAVPRDLLARPSLTDLDLRWNALTADPDVASLLDGLSSGQFSHTQTIAPTGLSVVGTNLTNVFLSWTSSSFQDVSGGYQVVYRQANQPAETALTQNISGKAVAYAVIGGLTSGTTYSFQIQAFSDPHAANPNTVVSDLSSPVLGQTASPDQTGQIVLTATTYSAAEGEVLQVGAERVGGVAGPLTVTPGLSGSGSNPAIIGQDIALITQSLQWADQEGGIKNILISVAAETGFESTKTAQVQLQASPSSLIGSPGTASIELLGGTIAGSADSPVVATDADGLQLSVWTVVETGCSKRDIWGRFTAGLTPSVDTMQFSIAATPEVDEYNPVVLPVADTFLVLWSTADYTQKVNLLFCEIDIQHARCKAKAKSIVDDPSMTEFAAAASGSTFWVLWRSASGVHLAQFSRAGRLIGRPQTATSDSEAAQPRLANLGTSGLLATWTSLVQQSQGGTSTSRLVLQGRSFSPARGFQSLLPDLAGPAAVQMRDFRLDTLPDGEALVSWVGVTIGGSSSGLPAPQIHMRRVGVRGTLEGSEVLLGCPSCGELIETHSLVAAPNGDCVVTWVSTPADGSSEPKVTRAVLQSCNSETSEASLRLMGTAFLVHRVEMSTASGDLLVLGQRPAAPSLDLRIYRCSGGTRCRN